jgi:hypothetical protein
MTTRYSNRYEQVSANTVAFVLEHTSTALVATIVFVVLSFLSKALSGEPAVESTNKKEKEEVTNKNAVRVCNSALFSLPLAGKYFES